MKLRLVLQNIKKHYDQKTLKHRVQVTSLRVFKSLETHQLQLILDRHLDPDRMEKYGTPDLFLFTSHKTTHSISRACFVEVKRPDEEKCSVMTKKVKSIF